MATLVPWVPESDWPLPLSQPMGWQNAGKMAQKGGKNVAFRGISRMQSGRKSRSLPGEIEALARPEADSETSLARRGSAMVQLPDLRG